MWNAVGTMWRDILREIHADTHLFYELRHFERWNPDIPHKHCSPQRPHIENAELHFQFAHLLDLEVCPFPLNRAHLRQFRIQMTESSR
jgi:hypothetical protein